MAGGIDLGIDELSDFQVIGRGGFSTIYSAWDGGFNRRVAVKVLHTLDESGRRRFDRERGIMGLLSSHPNVIMPFRAGYTAHGAPFLVMELVEGGSLQDLIVQRGAVPWAEAIDLVLPITAALGHAHEQGILHRDVKPGNILLATRGPKLTDFGIAAIRESTTTQIAYTLAHCPPEAFASVTGLRDERSDLYAMASTLYSLIAGRAPYQGGGDDTTQAYMFRILNLPVPRLPEGLAPESLQVFLQSALAKDPDLRPRNAHEFAERLRAVRWPTPATTTDPLPHPATTADPATATRLADGPGPAPLVSGPAPVVSGPPTGDQWAATLISAEPPVVPTLVAPVGSTAAPAPPRSPSLRTPPAPPNQPGPAGSPAPAPSWPPTPVPGHPGTGTDPGPTGWAGQAPGGPGSNGWAGQAPGGPGSNGWAAPGPQTDPGAAGWAVPGPQAGAGAPGWAVHTPVGPQPHGAGAAGPLSSNPGTGPGLVGSPTPRRRRRRALFLVPLVVVLAAALASGYWWSTSHRAPAEPTLAWRFETKSSLSSLPAVADGTLVIGAHVTSIVHALDTATGQPRWAHQAKGGVDAGPAIADGVVYIGDESGTMSALALTDGHLIWESDLGQKVTGGATVIGDSVVVGTEDGTVWSLARATGGRQWTAPTKGQINSVPALVTRAGRALVAVGSTDSGLYLLDPATGNQVDRITLRGGVWFSRPLVLDKADGTGQEIWIGTSEQSGGFLNRIDVESGKVNSFASQGGVGTSPTMSAEGYILAGNDAGELFAVDRTSVGLVWRNNYAITNQIKGSPVVRGPRAFFGTHNRELIEINTADGTVVWRYPGDQIFGLSGPVLAGDQLFAGNDSGAVYRFNLAP